MAYHAVVAHLDLLEDAADAAARETGSRALGFRDTTERWRAGMGRSQVRRAGVVWACSI